MARKKNRRWVSVGVSLGLSVSACNSRQEAPPLPTTTQATPKKEEAPTPNLEALSNAAQYALAPYAVDKSKFAQRVLYTWTTKAQLDALRVKPVLLSRAESPELGPSGFDQRVAAERGANYEMTELLQKPQLSLRRFAWPVPWATIMGFHGESYGNQLIKITLKEEALVASFTPRDAIHWQLADLSNQSVDREVLQAHPERLGAIYYEAEGESGALAYREYVLCNESMIESWEYATPAVLAALSHGEEALRKLSEWARVAPDPKEVARFFDATRAFPEAPYTAEVTSLEALADLMLVNQGVQGEALSINPSVAFVEIAAAEPAVATPKKPKVKPPPKPKRHMGTY